MKRNYLAILLLCALTGIYSCDYISNPAEPIPPPADCDTKPFPTTKPFHKVLVEDYTGHKCPNCPKAAISAHHLEEVYHDSVIVVALHVDFFAKPVPKEGYPEDFRTEAGDEYLKRFAFPYYPNGLVNRKDYLIKRAVKDHTTWSKEVRKVLDTLLEADIKIISDYNVANKNVCVSIQTTFLSPATAAGKYNLVLMLVQDSIVAPQLDDVVSVTDYMHRHVLRANINGNWGEEILNGSPVVGEPILKKYKFELKSDYGYEGKLTPKGDRIPCVAKKCYLVAFVYQAGPEPISYRILQAEEVKIIQ
jgi:thiol-disulfide isomerase/thioredoxin